MNIENQFTFEEALKTGINLFVGAGFSVLAKDRDGNVLPLGDQLKNELAEAFNKSSSRFTLPQLCSILESTSKDKLNAYIENRFYVDSFDERYHYLKRIKIKGVYTTNVDNLFYRLYEEGPFFLNDLSSNGSINDENCINYLALHGCIASETQQYVFDVASLANIHSNDPRIWSVLAQEMENRPTLFIGYSFSDTSVIQTITSQQTFHNARKGIWVVVRSEEMELAEYYRSLGFQVIEGDVVHLLEYFGSLPVNQSSRGTTDRREEYLLSYLVPRGIQDKRVVSRPIKDFYSGSSPNWFDILSNQIPRTHYFDIILNSVNSPNENTVIIGSPVSGKSTLLRQVAIATQGFVYKLFLETVTKSKAEFIIKLIGDSKTVIFLDNVYDSLDAVKVFYECSNVKLVCAERSHYYSIVSNYFAEKRFKIINVSALSDRDIQLIYNALPESIRGDSLKKQDKSEYESDSVFEFVIQNITFPNIKDRYSAAIRELERDDPELTEFIALCSYMHKCRIPLSFEMAYDYFDDLNYNAVFSLRDDAADIVRDYIPANDKGYSEMDYYYPRSFYVAEIVWDSCSSGVLKNVMEKAIERIPRIHIYNYPTFKRFAFDKALTSKAFLNWREGKAFYEKAFIFDSNNPFVLQQGALYLAQKKQYEIAFEWIDRAITMTNDRFFSIRNSHAIIHFDANYTKDGAESRIELDRSMAILSKCINDDSRKFFHAKAYARQALQYYTKYNDSIAMGYLMKAYEWMNQEKDNELWDKEMYTLKGKIESVIS